MGDHVGTRELPSDRHATCRNTGGACLALGAATLTADIVLCAFDQLTHADFSRGMYSILTGLFVVGLSGWLLTAAEGRVHRGQAATRQQIAELAAAIERLDTNQQDQRNAHPRCVGRTYVSQAAVGHSTPTPVPAAGLIDAETVAAAERISLRLLQGDGGN